MILTARLPVAASLTLAALVALSACASADSPQQSSPDPTTPAAASTPPSNAPPTPSPTLTGAAVNPQDYEVHGGGGWRFYTDSNISCIISKTIACMGAPLPGTRSKYTVATITDARAQLAWSDTQLKPFGNPFDATRFGRLLPSGSSLSAPLGECNVSGPVITCAHGGHSFTIDPAGSTAR
ncbi:hypothetical protein H7J55_29930 [Mycolicibacterium brisbanense]|uniref:Lipoprotein n=2 Tax=Mycolicibacterium brisbanense TaxID=146020 RepID=A0A100W1Y0_9MYCO|nr:hypothetical protein [Mycolicibacterium brisbanense]GAS90006.1 uncharacterized protein RMCB_4102 [Mycolicibacterium brisbanense]